MKECNHKIEVNGVVIDNASCGYCNPDIKGAYGSAGNKIPTLKQVIGKELAKYFQRTIGKTDCTQDTLSNVICDAVLAGALAMRDVMIIEEEEQSVGSYGENEHLEGFVHYRIQAILQAEEFLNN